MLVSAVRHNYCSEGKNSSSTERVALLAPLPLVCNKSTPTGDYGNLLVTKPITHPFCDRFHLSPAHNLHNHSPAKNTHFQMVSRPDMRKKTVAPKAGRIPRKMNANKDAVLI